MSAPTQASGDRETFEQQLAMLRPKLHRYCARMTGSVIDGEDVVQDAMVRAVAARREAKIANLESWLFRVAHNVAIDFLRRRAREDALRSNEDPEMIVDPFAPSDDPSIVAATLPAFMQLPATQRSSVILMDVLGYQIAEIGAIMSASVPAVKSALHRGRARLRELAGVPLENEPPAFSEPQRSLLAEYIDRFNARDFEAIRDMLADEVQLDLANRARRSGRVEVGGYFENYASVNDWQLKPGFVDLRPAILVCDPGSGDASPKYFVLIEWRAANVGRIRDFRYARYVMNDARISVELPERRGS